MSLHPVSSSPGSAEDGSLRELKFRGLRVSVEGFAGARLTWKHLTVCVDVPNPQGCDYALYTHPHPRHYAAGTPLAEDRTISPWLGPRVKPGDTLRLGEGVSVEVVEAYNRPDRGGTVAHPKGFGVGYVLSFEGLRVYHMGDTDLVDEVLGVAEEGVDLAFVPVGGGAVMTPDEAREAVRSLRPTLTIPVHYESERELFTFRDMVQPYTQVVILGERKWLRRF